MADIVTIEDIAKAAGVGKGTVDRVLHNRGRVSEETRERVLRCIKELDYKPNKAARMLAKKRNYRIAVTFHNEAKEFWDQIQKGVDQAAEEYKPLGVLIDYYILPKISVERQLEVIEHVVKSQYDGLAIVPYDSPEIAQSLNNAIAKGIEVVTFNNREQNVNSCYIGNDGRQSGRTAGKMLSMIAGKNSRYAIISAHNKRMAQIDERSEGLQEIIKETRKDMALIEVFTFFEDHKEVYQKVKDILQTRYEEIDAVYVTSAIAGTVAKAVEDSGIPKKILFIGHDLTETIISYMKKGIIDISIDQEPERQGYRAVAKICEKLLSGEMIEKDEYTRISVVVKENIDYI